MPGLNVLNLVPVTGLALALLESKMHSILLERSRHGESYYL
eukprot:SAG31_NODE_18410_length_637_cov_1.299257_1_plen_40_part_10